MAVFDVLAQLSAMDLAKLPDNVSKISLDLARLHQLSSVAEEASLKGGQDIPECAVFHAELAWAVGANPPPMKDLYQKFSNWEIYDRRGPSITIPCFPEVHEPLEQHLLTVAKEDRLQWCIENVKSIVGDQLREIAAGFFLKTELERGTRMLRTLTFTKLLPLDLERQWLEFFPEDIFDDQVRP